ncbi:hypothetical protein [Deinococcus hohokamensis]|uniref:Uncharacterized protein n=1 Tax=Deinococcus hohokamensis TaxID=309883 RepID=A0ABV9IAH3_9DEIO
MSLSARLSRRRLFVPPLAASVLAVALLLAGCQSEEDYRLERQQQRMEANALWYRQSCVEAVERFRAQTRPDRPGLPPALEGQSCQSPALGDYTLTPEAGEKVRSSLIQLDPSRLSDYVIQVVGLNGKAYTYRDNGKAAAAAEQAGTFTPGTPVPQKPADDAPSDEITLSPQD